ncbi:hypothetical protein [Aeromonas sp. R9-2]|uniref:hypothetical protein n=1 Tax=Aeromonas sp. R9-2 TaxID=3138479 RepID=UPI0034A3239F
MRTGNLPLIGVAVAVCLLVGYPGQPRREAWTVKQVGEQCQLISGKGSPVIAAN